MKPLAAIALILAMCGTASAQRRRPMNPSQMSPVQPIPVPPNTSRFGNILFPGGTPRNHITNLGRTISGVPYTGVGPGRHHGGRNRTIVVPYAVPVYAGGYYGGYGYVDPGYAPQPNVTVVMPQQPTPTVIINHHYASGQGPESTTATTGGTPGEQSSLRVYEGTPSSERASAKPPETRAGTREQSLRTYVRDDKPNIYAIALKDGTTRDAIGYWLKNGDLQFVTPQATIGTVSLDQVDIAETRKRNEERKLDFELSVP